MLLQQDIKPKLKRQNGLNNEERNIFLSFLALYTNQNHNGSEDTWYNKVK